MKKLITLFLLTFSITSFGQSWIAGGTPQGQFGSGYINLQFNFGAKGNVPVFTKDQVDSLFALEPTPGTALLKANNLSDVANAATSLNNIGGVSLSGSYVNPSWIVSLPFSKLTATPTTLAGYGITDGITSTFFNANTGTSTQSQINGKQATITLGTTSQYFRGDLSLATFPTGLPPTGTAGGDLTGTYPNPTVNTINSITKSYYDPTSSIQTQLNARELLTNKETTVTNSATLYPSGSAVVAYVSGFVPTSLSATSPIFYNNGTGVISSQPASFTQNGYMTNGTQNIGGAKTYNLPQLISDSTNGAVRYSVSNPFAGTSAEAGFIAFANDPYGNNSNYLRLSVFPYSYTGLDADWAGYAFIQSGGDSKGTINFFDGQGSWRVSTQKPINPGDHFSYDIFVPAASYSYSRPSPGVGFGTNKPNIARTDSMTRALTVMSSSRSLVELVDSGTVVNGTIAGSIYAYGHQAVANTIGRIDFINNGTHSNSGSFAVGTYRSGTYHQGLFIDSLQSVFMGGNIASITGNAETVVINGNTNGDIYPLVMQNTNTGTSARSGFGIANGFGTYVQHKLYSHTNASFPDRYQIYNPSGDITLSAGGSLALTLNADQTISPGAYATGTAGTDVLLVNHGGKQGTIAANYYAPIASPTFTGTVSSPITRLTNVSGVSGGTDSLLSKNATTNVITKIPATYYATAGGYVPYTGATTDLNLGGHKLLFTNGGFTGTLIPNTQSGTNEWDLPNVSGTIALTSSNVASATTASTVTTNANLTGPITSSGNATSIASQTGTGTTFVMNTSPTLVTPNIGVAAGTSLTLTSATASIFLNGTGGGAWIKWENNGSDDWLWGTHLADGTQNFKLYNIGTSSAALSVDKSTNNLTFTGTIAAPSFITSGGTTSQFIDGTGSLQTYGQVRTHTIFTPTTGQTISLTNNAYNIVNPSGALLALTINLPSTPGDNNTVYIKFTQNVTTVTYGNGTVVDGITAPTAGGLTILVYNAGDSKWY